MNIMDLAAILNSIFLNSYYGMCGRRGGLMVSALVLGSSGPGSSPGRGETLNYKPVAKDAYITDCKHNLQR